MDGGICLRSNDKKIKFIKSYKEQGILEIHDRLHSEGTRQTEKEYIELIRSIKPLFA